MKYSNKHNLPQSLYDAIVNDQYDFKNDKDKFSVTTLISPPKIVQLKIRHDNETTEDIADMAWILLGQSVHSIMERIDDNDDRVIEKRLNEKIGNATISGKIDLYENGIIQDYKVTSVYTIIYHPRGKKEWIEQQNIYAWLYRKAGYDVEGLRILAILRDFSKSKAKFTKNYPKIPFQVIDLPLWDMEETEEFIKEKVAMQRKYQDMKDDEIPCCEKEDRWAKDVRCTDYCPVNKFCNYYKEKENAS